MKSHKYWSLGALFCMLGCIYSGIRKSMTAHKYFAYSSLLCMGMSIYSGHKLVSPKKKKITESNNSENSLNKNWPLFIKNEVAGEYFSPAALSSSLSHWNTILSNQLRPTIIFILFTHLSANFIFHQYTEHLIIIKCPDSTIHMVFHCFLIYVL